MRTLKIYLFPWSIILLVFSAVLVSCEEEFTLELNDQENQRIVVEGRITNELKNHRVRLTRTLSYFDNQEVPPVLDAEIYLLEQGTGNRFNLSLTDSLMGYYETDLIQGTIGQNYSLIVEDGQDSYEASSYLDMVADLDSIGYEYLFQSYFGMSQGFYIIKISAYEPEPIGDIYMFNVYLNDTLLNDKLSETPYQNDDFFNGSYVSDIDITWIPQEKIYFDTNHVVVEMLSISKDELEYNTTFIQETYNNGSIFSGPPANIPSNFKCTSGDIDGLGFFGASAVVRQEMILLKEHNDSTNNPQDKIVFQSIKSQ